jgi:hypothetical protein
MKSLIKFQFKEEFVISHQTAYHKYNNRITIVNRKVAPFSNMKAQITKIIHFVKLLTKFAYKCKGLLRVRTKFASFWDLHVWIE